MSEIRQIEWDERLSPGENARRKLPPLMRAYISSVREELAKDPPPAALHQLRLATKRLRYTLELFRPCYGPGFEARLEILRRVQQRLGELNDSVAAWAVLSKTVTRAPERARVGKFLNARAGRQAKQFRAEWRRLFEAPGREEWWIRYLERSARRER